MGKGFEMKEVLGVIGFIKEGLGKFYRYAYRSLFKNGMYDIDKWDVLQSRNAVLIEDAGSKA